MVAIITDFGNKDPYVGIMKGVMLGIDSSLQFIDVTNEIKPQNIISASYVLFSAWDFMPEDTVFLVVVDPGVGSGRAELIGKAGGRIIVCPDNGLPSFLIRMGIKLEFHRADESLKSSLSGAKQWSNTFHGRDLFAPLAARAAAGQFYRIIGDAAAPIELPEVQCATSIVYSMKDGSRIAKLQGRVVHIDAFGNCVTSIHRNDIRQAKKELSLPETAQRQITISVAPREIQVSELGKTFSDVADGHPLSYIGSAGFIEIAVRNGNANKQLQISDRETVTVVISQPAGTATSTRP